MGPWLDSRIDQVCDDQILKLGPLLVDFTNSRDEVAAKVETQIEQGFAIVNPGIS